MSEPQGPSSSGVLDRLAKFFTSLAGVITAVVLLAGAIGGAIAYLKGGGGNGGTTGTVTTAVSPPPAPEPPPAPAPPPSLPETASLFPSRDSGPGGTTVLLSGEGFEPNERVVLRFHTEQIGSTTANADGKFSNVAVTIPTTFSQFAPQQFDLVATGQASARSAQTPFTLSG